ncbi:hypothetical protein C4D60_Mb11t10040 [Musa balbisiana]|uniref:Small ribosomal subunit protein eS31 domain-containing protein n=1 Tax=Musa balbisiana TaxID=52838 RepID=A0A4S8J302_MUSBA|nr:hypothetical protein C4D60_Mb11t10040 [Musa balbisiana]
MVLDAVYRGKEEAEDSNLGEEHITTVVSTVVDVAVRAQAFPLFSLSPPIIGRSAKTTGSLLGMWLQRCWLLAEGKNEKKVKLAVLQFYKVDDATGKVTRLRKECPNAECGAGTFMANHFDRHYCGKCGLTYVYQKAQGGLSSSDGNTFLFFLFIRLDGNAVCSTI